ncbi:MAG: methionyl-tRNA formyltransferase [Thermodesulfobacteriota bacterium]
MRGVLEIRIIVVGQDPFGEKVLQGLVQKGENVVGVFCPADKRGEAMKELAGRERIPFFRPIRIKDPQVYDGYVKLRPDLVLLAYVTDIIPERWLSVPSLGAICYHPSLLPRHRGASAINWSIIQGETRTGLTIFWVEKGIDTGPILLQKEVEIGPEDTAGSLYFNILFPLGVGAMTEAVELIRRGKAHRIPQIEAEATYEPLCDDRVASVDFEKSIKDIYNLIRGCDPQPGAYTTLKGRKVRLYDAKMDLIPGDRPSGEILSIDERGIQIAVKGGLIRIGKLRVDKGEKIGPIEFASSVDLKRGDRCGPGSEFGQSERS